MTTLRAAAAVALDENAREFILAFTSHVATLAGRGPYRSATTTRVQSLLLAAIAPGDGDSLTAWSMLHRTIAELVAAAQDALDTRSAHAYLQSFLRENIDLDPCEPVDAAADGMNRYVVHAPASAGCT
jgi:hypothetical protein